MLGGAHYIVEDYRTAVDDENRALKSDPKDALALSIRGQGRYALADYRGAIQDETASIDQNPDPVSFATRGFAEFAVRQFADSERDERAAIGRGGATYSAYVALGNDLYGLHQYRAALAAYGAALKLDSDPRLKAFWDRLRAKLNR
jgi:tetratricopeptide (TPR) repeat protein